MVELDLAKVDVAGSSPVFRYLLNTDCIAVRLIQAICLDLFYTSSDEAQSFHLTLNGR